jgi:MFS family permease
MFLSAIVLALIVGALAGGGFPRLAELRLRWFWLLGAALALRVAAQVAGDGGLEISQEATSAAFLTGYLLIFAWLWANWRVPGLQIAAVGIGANALALVVNGGRMPVWEGAYTAAGFAPGQLEGDPFHYLLTASSAAEFLRSGGLLGDVVPVPIPFLRDVLSIGDLLLALGIFWAIVFAMTRPGAPLRRSVTFTPIAARPIPGGAFGASMALSVALPSTLPAPVLPRIEVSPADGAGAAALGQAPAIPVPRARPRTQSPYLRLSRNRNFSLLWMGQLVSFLGDRIHQVALGVLVLQVGTPLDFGLTMAATAFPNVFLGPLAGALVDRWDRKRTMVISDLGRAALVLMVPIAIEVHIGLVYLIAFVLATVSLFFRPAKTAALPLIVADDELVTANSANTVGETIADIGGFPLAAAIVAALSGIIGAAFAIDAATYVVSAVLIAAMSIPAERVEKARIGIGSLWREIVDGWRFLTGQAELLANTAVSSVAQIAVGTEIVVSFIYAKEVLLTDRIGFPENYSLLMSALGIGSVVGGIIVGQAARTAPKGLLAIAGFVTVGLAMIGVGLVNDPLIAIGFYFVIGIANVAYLVANVTLFQERTPQALMGRVISTRQALVFGVIALSMIATGALADIFGAGPVFIAAGVLSALAGLAGLLIPAMRRAR